jgi:hypothetical protein
MNNDIGGEKMVKENPGNTINAKASLSPEHRELILEHL